MGTSDAATVEWIRNHLDVTHDALTELEARQWLKLFMKSPKDFYSLAIYGFTSRRNQQTGQKTFQADELLQFTAEFFLKVQLAISRRKYAVSFPLFDTVGNDVLLGFKVIKPPVKPLPDTKSIQPLTIH